MIYSSLGLFLKRIIVAKVVTKSLLQVLAIQWSIYIYFKIIDIVSTSKLINWWQLKGSSYADLSWPFKSGQKPNLALSCMCKVGGIKNSSGAILQAKCILIHQRITQLQFEMKVKWMQKLPKYFFCTVCLQYNGACRIKITHSCNYWYRNRWTVLLDCVMNTRKHGWCWSTWRHKHSQ